MTPALCTSLKFLQLALCRMTVKSISYYEWSGREVCWTFWVIHLGSHAQPRHKERQNFSLWGQKKGRSVLYAAKRTTPVFTEKLWNIPGCILLVWKNHGGCLSYAPWHTTLGTLSCGWSNFRQADQRMGSLIDAEGLNQHITKERNEKPTTACMAWASSTPGFVNKILPPEK